MTPMLNSSADSGERRADADEDERARSRGARIERRRTPPSRWTCRATRRSDVCDASTGGVVVVAAGARRGRGHGRGRGRRVEEDDAGGLRVAGGLRGGRARDASGGRRAREPEPEKICGAARARGRRRSHFATRGDARRRRARASPSRTRFARGLVASRTRATRERRGRRPSRRCVRVRVCAGTRARISVVGSESNGTACLPPVDGALNSWEARETAKARINFRLTRIRFFRDGSWAPFSTVPFRKLGAKSRCEVSAFQFSRDV